MDNIKASPTQIDMFSSKIKGSAQELQGILDELRSKLDGMQWTGGDKEQYEIQRAEWTKTVMSLNELLGRVGQTVQLAGNNYGNTERTNANLFA